MYIKNPCNPFSKKVSVSIQMFFLHSHLLGPGGCCVHNMIGLKQTNLKALWRNRLVRSVPIPKVRSSIPGICGTFGKNTKIPFSTKILFEIIYTKL